MLQNNAFCGEFVDGNIRTYLCIHVKCLIFLSDLNQILLSSTDPYKSPHYHILRKSAQRDQCWYTQTRTDRQTRRSQLALFATDANAPRNTEPQCGRGSVVRDSNPEPPNSNDCKLLVRDVSFHVVTSLNDIHIVAFHYCYCVFYCTVQWILCAAQLWTEFVC